jgi:sulfonate transport system substrate-binding protein
LIAIAILLSTLLSACSSNASTRSADGTGSGTTVPARVDRTKPVPAGTELRIGDQFDYLKTILEAGGQSQDLPYKLTYSSFVGGPPMLQAFRGGAIDTGNIGTTPLILAQAQRQDIRAVAAWATEGSPYSLVTAPGGTDINGWGDLKGKRVVYQRGTALEAALLQALDGAGLSLADITPVDVPATDVGPALQGGSGDAGILLEPLTSVYLDANPTARRASRTTELTDRTNLLIASGATLADEAKSAALADYVSRLVRGFNFLRTHPEVWADSFYVKLYGLSPERAKVVIAETGVEKFFILPGELAKSQQRLADLLVRAGEVPSSVDATNAFDARFNQVVEEDQTG